MSGWGSPPIFAVGDERANARVGQSAIEGQGVVAIAAIEPGQAIIIAAWGPVVMGAATLLLPGFNHSCDPNCDPSERDESKRPFALRRIEAGEEVTVDYGLPLSGFACRCGACR